MRGNPILLSLLGLAALVPFMFVWELVFEPYFFGAEESTSETLRDIVMACLGGVVALLIPTYLAVRDRRRRDAAKRVLKDAIDTIPDAFVIHDAQSRLIVCNRRFRDLYGYSEAEARPGVTRSELGARDAARGVTVDGHGGEEFRKRRRVFRENPEGAQ
ncbi:MAG: PAS-domain containing protein [Rhodospirillaceae bacterium]